MMGNALELLQETEAQAEEERRKFEPEKGSSDGSGWESPIPLDGDALPAFPSGAFPEPLRSYIKAVSESTQTPVELPSSVVLSVAATACQGKYCVQVKGDYSQPLNLWTVCCLPPASRKSEVFKKAMEPLIEFENEERKSLEPIIRQEESDNQIRQMRIQELRKNLSKPKLENKLSLEGELRDLESEELNPECSLPRLRTEDTTPERLASLMAENGERIALLSDEGGVFGILAGRYNKNGGPNLDVFLKSHEGTSIIVDRKNGTAISLQSPCLTMGVTIQPDVLRSLSLTPEFRGRGLLGRFLYTVPESNIGNRRLDTKPIPINVAESYRETIQSLLKQDTGDSAAILEIDVYAYDVWADFWQECETAMTEGGHAEHLRDWTGKLPAAVARIAAIFHCIRRASGRPEESKIEIQDMIGAVNLGKAFQVHAYKAFGMMSGGSESVQDAKTVLNWIKNNGVESFRIQELYQSLRHKFPKREDLDRPLKMLEDFGYLRIVVNPPGSRGGKPLETCSANPYFLKGISG